MKESLYFENFGKEGHPIFICLHGLLGSSRNWRGVAKTLANFFLVVSIDLRNHGDSFHSEDASIQAMSNDLLKWMDDQGHQSVILCGHSLGGKVAMRLACDFPSRVEKLIIADIAPRDYPPEHHIPPLDSMLELELSSYSSRKEIDSVLASKIPNWSFRQFLLTNLETETVGFRWKPNLKALRQSIDELSRNPMRDNDQFTGSSLFVRGEKSGYLRTEHIPEAKKYFPNSQFAMLPGVGHNLHVEDRGGFLKAIDEFIG